MFLSNVSRPLNSPLLNVFKRERLPRSAPIAVKTGSVQCITVKPHLNFFFAALKNCVVSTWHIKVFMSHLNIRVGRLDICKPQYASAGRLYPISRDVNPLWPHLKAVWSDARLEVTSTYRSIRYHASGDAWPFNDYLHESLVEDRILSAGRGK